HRGRANNPGERITRRQAFRGSGQLARFAFATPRFAQESVECETQQDAQAAKDHERPSPTILLADPGGEKPAGDRADVDARLVPTQGPRPRRLAVVVAQQGRRGGIVEGLAEPLGGAKEEQMAKVPGKGGGHTDEAPDVETQQDCRLAPDAV